MRMKNVQDIYPLSPMQQGMLFHTLYAPQSGAYFEQRTCTLRGELDIPAFEQAWQRLIDRHPVLRTAFVSETVKEPVQVVYRQVDLPLGQHDWRGLCAPFLRQYAHLRRSSRHGGEKRDSAIDVRQTPQHDGRDEARGDRQHRGTHHEPGVADRLRQCFRCEVQPDCGRNDELADQILNQSKTR